MKQLETIQTNQQNDLSDIAHQALRSFFEQNQRDLAVRDARISKVETGLEANSKMTRDHDRM